MLSVSKKLRAKIKLNNIPAYRIAQLAGMDPSTLSKLICGISTIKPNDPRVIKVGEVLGISAEGCFQEDIPK
ncbi:MAG: helix-turn-helix transcriptional regulator [Thermodesulfobacteriota bacterium]|nr:helix-turn-helix transcriptional regulator [Thermodesulfobacteriota bacterium]